MYVALKKRNSLFKVTTLRLLLTTTVLPSSWFIGPFYSLCQILTKDLTNKMLMHVKKIISLDSYLNIVLKNIMFGDMREHFLSLICGQNLARNTMGTHKPGQR